MTRSPASQTASPGLTTRSPVRTRRSPPPSPHLRPHAPEPWIDLSTGINPEPYPDVRASAAARARLRMPEETRALNGIKYYADWDSGYSKQQSTRPQTLGYGLTDSPSGQAAWILEKFWAWTDCDGHPENILSRDELLDNIMLYWVPATAASSARLYWESFGPKRRTAHKVTVPTGVAVFPKEIVTPVRRWMEASFSNIRHWNEMPKGGHFAAFEQPDLFVREVRDFFRTLR